MASSMLSSTTVTPIKAQANIVVPFTGLKSNSASLPYWSPGRARMTFLLSQAMDAELDACRSPGYYDGRYWTMWKLPMFGCTDFSQLLKELEEAKKAHPKSFVRIIGFDNVRQVQCISFIAYKPPRF